jgi:DNA-binding response OmpR family regulator
MNEMIKNFNASTRPSELIPLNGPRDNKGTGQGLCVLIVEDHDLSRYCLEGFLQKQGYRVSSLACGEDGLDRLRADRFDILLTDLHLPGMNGFELIAKAKAVQPSIHILMMTAAASLKVREKAQVAGVDILMEKPLKLNKILAFIDSILYHEKQLGAVL